jgi:hypothetical protein
MNRVYFKALIESNIGQLKQIENIIEDISDQVYQNNESPYFTSGVGKHLRHILGFYNQFLAGWKERVDYDARVRDAHLENDRAYGIQKTREMVGRIFRLTEDTVEFERPLYVKNDEHGPDGDPSLYTRSTLERELQFLRFHTVHHFAIIAMILKIQGIEPPEDFGFAPSTLTYLEAHAKQDH